MPPQATRSTSPEVHDLGSPLTSLPSSQVSDAEPQEVQAESPAVEQVQGEAEDLEEPIYASQSINHDKDEEVDEYFWSSQSSATSHPSDLDYDPDQEDTGSDDHLGDEAQLGNANSKFSTPKKPKVCKRENKFPDLLKMGRSPARPHEYLAGSITAPHLSNVKPNVENSKAARKIILLSSQG